MKLDIPREITLRMWVSKRGHLCIRSTDVPGLFMSSSDHDAVLRDFPEVLSDLIKMNGLTNAEAK
jgi:hypothetical protein